MRLLLEAVAASLCVRKSLAKYGDKESRLALRSVRALMASRASIRSRAFGESTIQRADEHTDCNKQGNFMLPLSLNIIYTSSYFQVKFCVSLT